MSSISPCSSRFLVSIFLLLKPRPDNSNSLFDKAVEVVARHQKASTSFLQRQLKIGYNRAADLIDRMEAEGIVGHANHVGKREVLVRNPNEDS